MMNHATGLISGDGNSVFVTAFLGKRYMLVPFCFPSQAGCIAYKITFFGLIFLFVYQLYGLQNIFAMKHLESSEL